MTSVRSGRPVPSPVLDEDIPPSLKDNAEGDRAFDHRTQLRIQRRPLSQLLGRGVLPRNSPLPKEVRLRQIIQGPPLPAIGPGKRFEGIRRSRITEDTLAGLIFP